MKALGGLMTSTTLGFICPSLRVMTALACLCFGAWNSARAEGTFVLSGELQPEAPVLQVLGGQQAHIDLLLRSALPVENEFRVILFAASATSVAKLSDQTSHFPAVAEGKTGSRISLSVAIPAANPGAKFVLRVESLSLGRQLLGTANLQIPEFDPVEELRRGVGGRQIVLVGPSLRLRALFSVWQIPFADQSESDGPGALALFESSDKVSVDPTQVPSILIEVSFGSSRTLELTGRPLRMGWKVDARLPRSTKTNDREAAGNFSELLRFITQLENPSIYP